jgi:hypothetical protein
MEQEKRMKKTKSDLIPTPTDQLPAIPPESNAAWKVVEERVGHQTKTYIGLRYLLAGYTYREAEKAANVKHPTLRDAIVNLGIQDAVATTSRALTAHRRIRQGAQEILIKQIEGGQLDNEKAATLGIVMGIADDKVRAHEDKQGHGNNALSALEAIGKRIADAGVKLDITISPVAAYAKQPEDETETIEAESPESPEPDEAA